MTIDFRNTGPDPNTDRYLEDLESAMMAEALAGMSGMIPQRRKSLMRFWLIGNFNAAAAGVIPARSESGMFEWRADNDNQMMHLMYLSPTGAACHIGRVYPQENGSYAALVIAGVKDDPHEAMSATEWAISLLTAGA